MRAKQNVVPTERWAGNDIREALYLADFAKSHLEAKLSSKIIAWGRVYELELINFHKKA